LVNKQLTEKNELIEKLQVDLINFDKKKSTHNEQQDDSYLDINSNSEELEHKRNENVNLQFILLLNIL
jgi:hypothetical protein